MSNPSLSPKDAALGRGEKKDEKLLPSQEQSGLSHVPYHVFTKPVKTILVVIVSVAATLSGLSSNVFFPAQRDIAQGLSVAPYVVNFAITSYLIAQGLAPSVWGPLADLFGRRVILLATLTVYAIANIVLAVAPNATVLIVFRAVQAAGSASTISLGAGVIADIAGPAERGWYLGIFSGARQSSLALGPVLGGLLAGFLGWRSIFWFLLIVSGVVLVMLGLTLPETLRRISGNGSTPSHALTHRPLLASTLPYMRSNYTSRHYGTDLETRIVRESEETIRERRPLSISIFLTPFSMLVEKDVACALFFGACTYTAWSMMIATTTVLLKHNYHFNTIQIGLCFLANGIGCVLGSLLSGRALNESFQRETDLWNHAESKPHKSPVPRPLPLSFPIERARLSDAPQHSVIMIIGFLIFGWSLTPPPLGVGRIGTAGHWITPLLAQFVVGYSNTSVLNSNNALIVDLFPGKSASASAVINLSRNLTAAVGVAIVDFIEDGLSDAGWIGVVFASMVVAGVIPLGFHAVWGSQWRSERERRLQPTNLA